MHSRILLSPAPAALLLFLIPLLGCGSESGEGVFPIFEGDWVLEGLPCNGLLSPRQLSNNTSREHASLARSADLLSRSPNNWPDGITETPTSSVPGSIRRPLFFTLALEDHCVRFQKV